MTIFVRVARPGQTAVLWERHPDHPGKEVFLIGAGVFEVAPTPAVQARIRDGRLVEVDRPAARPPKAALDAEPDVAPDAAEEMTDEGQGAAEEKPAARKARTRKGGL